MRAFSCVRVNRLILYIQIMDRPKTGFLNGNVASVIGGKSGIGRATAMATTRANACARVTLLAETKARPIRVCHCRVGKKFTRQFPYAYELFRWG
jgi:hypothetical protein